MKLLLQFLSLLSVLLMLCASVSCVIKSELQANVVRLTENFFANLQEDPYLKSNILSESSKMFIDKQVANYMALIKQTHGLLEHSLTRRSLPIEDVTTLIRDNTGVYILEGFMPLFNMKVHFPKDIALFRHDFEGNETWYAAVLESKAKNAADDLVLYKLVDNEFVEITRVPVTNGIKLGVHSTSNTTYIIVAEHNAPVKNFHEKTGIFEFASNKLTKIQSLDNEYATGVVLWEDQHQTFMTVAQHMANTTGKITYEIETPIYKWLGKHFDVISHIKTYGAQRISPFVIGNSHFLAVANFQNDFGNTNIYSEIFKYNLHKDQFEPYQKILTRAAVDVKHFSFKEANANENFLIFANHFDIEVDGTKNYETDSIVYKYVDDYFIPFQSFKLNGALEWLPVSGQNGEFVLLAACKFEGVKAFQYDGWKFVEAQAQYTHEAFSNGVVSMRSYQFHGKPVVVVANENDHGNMMNVFEPTFTHQKMLSKFQDDMLLWCENSLKDIEALDLNKIVKKVDDAPEQDDSVLTLSQNVAFNNVTVENLVVEPNSTDSEEPDELDALKSELDTYSEELDKIEQEVQLALHTNGTNIFHGDVYIQNLILNSTDSRLDSINAETINDIQITDVLDNVLNINEGFAMEEPMEFQSIVIDNPFEPKFINDQPIDALLYRNTDQQINNLVVNGDVICGDGVVTDGTLNGIKFTRDNILLNSGDQTFSDLNLDALSAERAQVGSVNGFNMSRIESLNDRKVLLQNITNLTVKNALVSGLINGADIPTLEKTALKAVGDQVLTNKITFDTLHVNNLQVETLNGEKIPDNLVLTHGGNYRLDYDIEFVNNFTANTVFVTHILNNIAVFDDGRLDVVLADSPDVQYITAHTEVANLELNNPLKLQGKINSSHFEEKNPVISIDEEITLRGDFVINGNVTMENLLQATDMQSTNAALSVRNLQDVGLGINESKIPVHLNFVQQLNVGEVFADTINDMDVQNFVIMGSNESQIITGWKQFPGDVFITGPTKLEVVNGIYLPGLESDVLKINGDQTLNGKYHFENVVANRVYNVKTEFGGNLWENVMTNYGDQRISGTTLIDGSLKIKQLQANTIQCASSINGFNLTALVSDTVFRTQNSKILGHKHFHDLRTENLDVPSLNLELLPQIIENAKTKFEFDEDVNFPNDIAIENIFFNGDINGIPSESFGEQWLTQENEQDVQSDQTFKQITIFGNLFVESGLINDVSIGDISENSAKIDEEVHFTSVTFSNGLASFKPVLLDGQFESLDLNDIVLSHTKEEQIIRDQITFNGDVTIFGEAFFNGPISGLNLTQFCEFAFSLDDAEPKSLHINGNAYFVKGPVVYYINNRPVHEILDNAWFTNQEAVITGNMEFGQALFHEDIVVNGLIDGVNLQSVAETYFSKSRDQNITSTLNFDDVIFGKGLYAKQAVVAGDIGGINLDEFVSTALLDGFEQIFENTIYVEECEIQDLRGDYLVNGFNLQTDVMRYDVNNLVTGKKVIQDVDTDRLLIDKNVKVQNVDVLWWMHSMVLKSGTFRIPGKVTFLNHTVFSNGISSQYLVNGLKFNQESIMLKSIPQEITGRKVFRNGDQPLQFKSVKLRGLLNGVDMYDLLNRRAYKNQNIVFNGPVEFRSTIVTPNVNIEKLYQGVNVSELVHNITRFAFIENYQESYQGLLNISYAVRNSLQGQAYFVDHYKVKQIYSVDSVIPVKLPGIDAQRLALITRGSQNYLVQFDVWDNVTEAFHSNNDATQIKFEIKLNYIKGLMFNGKEHWYIEHEINTPNDSVRYEGSLYEITNANIIKVVPSIIHNGTQSVISVIIPDLNKGCILALFVQDVVLYCENVDQSTGRYLDEYQRFPAYNSSEASTYLIKGSPYIFIINKGQIQAQPSVDIWKYDLITKHFHLEQIIYVTSPSSVTVAYFESNYYLAIASGHLQNAKHSGLVDIRKFNENSQQFVPWQDINLNAPTQVELVNLPTKEFVLYVLTDNPVEPLIIYAYEGISQFRQKIVASTLPKTLRMQSFTTIDNKHFIVAQNVGEIRIIQAVFKGEKFDI